MFTIEFNKEKPLYEQLYFYIKNEIENNNIKGGEKLPSKRELASHLKISIVTVENAYAQLVAEGYVYSLAGSGFFAEKLFESDKGENRQRAEEEIKIDENKIKFDFKTNSVDTAYFPFFVWAKLSREVLSEQSDELLNACNPQGVLVLRQEIAKYLKSFRGVDVEPQQIIVGAGSEFLNGLIVQLLGRDNAYGVENPGYQKTFKVFNANTSRVFPIPMDEKGACADAITNFGINVLHITPSHHFPLGTVMPVSRRQELLSWCYASDDRYIIEDDYDSEFRFVGRPIQTFLEMDKRERVIYTNSFAKSLAPSFRISYMVLPKSLLARFVNKLGFYSCSVPVFEQLTLAKFMGGGHFDRHVNRMKKVYKRRRDMLIETINNTKLSQIVKYRGVESGLHLVLNVENEMSQSELIASAKKRGVKVYGLSEYFSFPVINIPDDTVILGFSGMNEEKIENAIKLLEKAWCGD